MILLASVAAVFVTLMKLYGCNAGVHACTAECPCDCDASSFPSTQRKGCPLSLPSHPPTPTHSLVLTLSMSFIKRPVPGPSSTKLTGVGFPFANHSLAVQAPSICQAGEGWVGGREGEMGNSMCLALTHIKLNRSPLFM